MATAVAELQKSLSRIEKTDERVNAFTEVLATRSLAKAQQVDSLLETTPRASATDERMSLARVPFAVKNLFDIEGITTLAGSKIERDKPPAKRDAVLVRRLESAGAVLVGALNMDEYAYGFTTENTHYGPTRNPHDLTRISGGSSGGSAAAVAAGQVPLSLGSDTNGSIRVPASLCGVFGFKPTYGRLPRTGSYPFVASLDHLGSFANSVRLLAQSYEVMQGLDSEDPAQTLRAPDAVMTTFENILSGLRIGVLKGWFHDMALPSAHSAVAQVAQQLGATQELVWPHVDRARAAAFLITNAESSALHLNDLKNRAADFEPLSRDRFIAGCLLPAAWITQAQRVRHWFARQVAQSFTQVDLVIAPATPCIAPVIGTEWLAINGLKLPARASMGLLTQPISAIGLPVVTVPVWGCDPDAPHMPLGVQLIAAPWREDICLRAARVLERSGLCSLKPALMER